MLKQSPVDFLSSSHCFSALWTFQSCNNSVAIIGHNLITKILCCKALELLKQPQRSALCSFSWGLYCLLNFLSHNQPDHQQTFFHGSWDRTGESLDQPKYKCHSFSFSSWKVSKFLLFVCVFLPNIYDPQTQTLIFQALLHLIPFEEIYFTTLGSSQKIASSQSLVVMPNCG